MPLNEGTVESKGLTTEGIIDLLEEDTTEEEKDKEEEEVTEEEDKEDKEEKDDEDEDEEKEEEELKLDDDEKELLVPHRKQEILKEFPTIFKKFPYLEHAYFGYGQYTEIFPTVDDAKEAQEKSQILDSFEQDVMSGSIDNILQAVKKEPKAFNKLADDYLPALNRIAPDVANHVVGNIYKNALISMYNHAEENKNEELKEAVTLLHQFLFSTNKWTPPSKLSKEVDTTESDKIKEERRQLALQRYDDVQSDLQIKVDNAITSTIANNIDKTGILSPFEKKHATKEAFELLEKTLLSDKVFKGQIDRLWKAAYAANYSRATLDRIKTAFLSKAKATLPDVIKQARNEALKGKGRKSSSSDSEKDKRGHLPVGRSSSGGNKEKEEKGGKKPGETTQSFFMRD